MEFKVITWQDTISMTNRTVTRDGRVSNPVWYESRHFKNVFNHFIGDYEIKDVVVSSSRGCWVYKSLRITSAKKISSDRVSARNFLVYTEVDMVPTFITDVLYNDERFLKYAKMKMKRNRPVFRELKK